jgi:hypothetical protein
MCSVVLQHHLNNRGVKDSTNDIYQSRAWTNYRVQEPESYIPQLEKRCVADGNLEGPKMIQILDSVLQRKSYRVDEK